MNIFEILVEVGATLVVAGWLLKRRSEEASLEAEPIPVPVRSHR
ncbi:hypothetical protein [Nodosilinea sp. E11]|nr:hypothetical protein [Nodosilinea sp. E11]WOD38534.1 hypothetical protein RRF56_20195 [Nodosilinea sp. E11]